MALYGPIREGVKMGMNYWDKKKEHRMKKLMAMALAAVFVMSLGSVVMAAECGKGMGMGHGGMKGCMEMKGGCFCCMDADFKVTNTKDGVTVEVTAKKGGADAKKIQAAAKKCLVDRACMNKMGKDGDKVCPVSGAPVKDGKDAVTAEYEGKTYYFCCNDCKEKFLKDPKKYAKK